MKHMIVSLLLGLTLLQVSHAERVEVHTVLGTRYQVDPRYGPVLEDTIARVRHLIRKHRAQGKLIGFISIPLSTRAGSYRPLNSEVSVKLKARLERRFGEEHFWALAPGLVESTLPEIDGQHPGGGEYMYMWTEILAGEKGLGEDFDMVHFTGPSDFARALGMTGRDDLGRLKEFVKERSQNDPDFAKFLADGNREAFLRYYGLRASVTFSKGAHDEWNLFRKVNQRRRKELGISQQLPLYFDGRPLPPSSEGPAVSPGYEIH